MSKTRYYEPTPSGGDYLEFCFFNDKYESVDESVATKCVVRECKNDGTLLSETWASCD